MAENGQMKLLSKRDTICLLELIEAALYCNDAGGFQELMERLKYIVPHDFAVCALARINADRTVTSYDTVNISYPDEWLSTYKLKDYHRIDPVVKENFMHFKLQYWAETYKKHAPSREFILQAEDFGLIRGYTHGLRNLKGGECSIFSFAGPSVEYGIRTKVLLKHLVPHFHQMLVRVIRSNKEKQNAVLSLREKEILNWIRLGKSTWEISTILGISENTVKYHVKTILEKLDAVSRPQAVAIAIQERLIDLD